MEGGSRGRPSRRLPSGTRVQSADDDVLAPAALLVDALLSLEVLAGAAGVVEDALVELELELPPRLSVL